MNRMMKVGLTVCCALFMATAAQARDYLFYGVKVKSEAFLPQVMTEAGSIDPTNIPKAEGVDPRVYARAAVECNAGSGKILNLTVSNRSDKSISADRTFTEYIIVTKSGERVTLSENDTLFFPSNVEIAAGRNVIFKPSVTHLDVEWWNVRMIICSYDMGQTKIMLLPIRKEDFDKLPQAKDRVVYQAKKQEGAVVQSTGSTFVILPEPKKPEEAKAEASPAGIFDKKDTGSIKRKRVVPPVQWDSPGDTSNLIKDLWSVLWPVKKPVQPASRPIVQEQAPVQPIATPVAMTEASVQNPVPSKPSASTSNDDYGVRVTEEVKP